MGTPAEIRETSCGSQMGYFELGDYWPVSVKKWAPRRFKRGWAPFLWFPSILFFGSCLARLIFVKTTVETLNACLYWNVLRRCLGSTDDFGIWSVSVFSRQFFRMGTPVLVRENVGEGGIHSSYLFLYSTNYFSTRRLSCTLFRHFRSQANLSFFSNLAELYCSFPAT